MTTPDLRCHVVTDVNGRRCERDAGHVGLHDFIGVAHDVEFDALTGEQRSRYDEAVRCGATHNAMEAAIYY